LPPSFADPNRKFLGRWLELKANWRLGAENGIDSAHFYVHRNSQAWSETKLIVPPAISPKINHLGRLTYRLRPGPVGLQDDILANWTPIFDAGLEDQPNLVSSRMPEDGVPPIPDTISIWLPGIIEVNPWPPYASNFYEFYVPIDENTQRYFQLSSMICETPQKETEYKKLYEDDIKPRFVDDFAGDDMLARLGMQDAYRNESAWVDETLTRTDEVVIAWRQLISRYARGAAMHGPSQQLVPTDQELLNSVLGENAPQLRTTNMP
jgi:carbazole 1,9a-dioxygenase terminal dioxygenase component